MTGGGGAAGCAAPRQALCTFPRWRYIPAPASAVPTISPRRTLSAWLANPGGTAQAVSQHRPVHSPSSALDGREAWINKRPPVWTRVHALPGFVRFPHQRHIKILGTESCTTCHGDVRTMPQVYQVATLKMGWCVNCHVQRNVTRDCTVCHY